MRIYMDHAATCPVDERVRKAMEPCWSEVFGNPSSLHSHGHEAREWVENARKQVAALLMADPDEIIFTGSGTESDNTAIQSIGLAMRKKGDHIITTAIEHHAILHTCKFMETLGFRITILPVDRNGLVDPDDIKKAIGPKTILISVMHANNEIGTIQPIEAIGALAKERGVLFHTDAVQTSGHLGIDVKKSGIDLLSMSAHKLYGPKGVGVLYLRKDTPFIPFMHGGAQEKGRRSATLDVSGIVGLGKASAIAMEEMNAENERLLRLRNSLYRSILKLEGVTLNGHPEKRLANNLNLSFEHVEGEALLMQLDMAGISASSGSACSSGSDEPSHVLLSIGLSPEKARGSLRLTLGRFTTEEEIDRTAEEVIRTVQKLRDLSPFGKK